jgi:cysteinyl-tRNA synthetase
MIRLHNTLTNTVEEFKPLIPTKAGLYHCGPTVYDYAHVGNLRSYVFADILRRALESQGFTTHQIINITDIGHLSSDADDGDDKMTKGLKREGKPLTLEAMKELADFYTEKFVENLKALNIKLPHEMPKASEHIKEDIEIISTLEQKGFVYKTSDGVYFDTSKDASYGKLGHILKTDDKLETRIGTNPEKKNPRDFAVWKFNDALGFPSPWGQGFPGWHIECSAMSMKYLGQTFDIHTGGIDHIPVHHNNEITQSESATGKPFVKYWVHHAHIVLNDEKMAKSVGNTFQLKDLQKKGIDPLAYRYWLLGASYRTQMNFTDEAITGAQNAYKKFVTNFHNLGTEIGEQQKKYVEDFYAFIQNDLDTPKALALAWDLFKDVSVLDADKKATILEFNKILGFNLESKRTESIPQEIIDLSSQRETARLNKDWKRSDELRDEILKKGYSVKDTDQGPIISKI